MIGEAIDATCDIPGLIENRAHSGHIGCAYLNEYLFEIFLKVQEKPELIRKWRLLGNAVQQVKTDLGLVYQYEYENERLREKNEKQRKEIAWLKKEIEKMQKAFEAADTQI